MKQKIIAIVGPTASGKSSLAVMLAKKYNGEIISADSRQIYKGLDIGTGKILRDTEPTKNLKSKTGIFLHSTVPHYLIDIWNPKKFVSVSEYKEKAEHALADIVSREKVPVVCGGTGFYVDTFLFDRTLPLVGANPKLRTKLENLSMKSLAQKLQTLDPKRAQTIDLKNRVRLIRALEIIDALGIVPPLTQSLPYDVLFIGLKPKEAWLKQKISMRLMERMKEGMVVEAKKLHSKGVSFSRMESLGLEYKYLALFLQKKLTKTDMLRDLESAIWQYSKRQMTWFQKNKKIIWLDPALKSTEAKASKLVKYFLT